MLWLRNAVERDTLEGATPCAHKIQCGMAQPSSPMAPGCDALRKLDFCPSPSSANGTAAVSMPADGSRHLGWELCAREAWADPTQRHERKGVAHWHCDAAIATRGYAPPKCVTRCLRRAAIPRHLSAHAQNTCTKRRYASARVLGLFGVGGVSKSLAELPAATSWGTIAAAPSRTSEGAALSSATANLTPSFFEAAAATSASAYFFAGAAIASATTSFLAGAATTSATGAPAAAHLTASFLGPLSPAVARVV